MTETEKELSELRQKAYVLYSEREYARAELKECANELCLKCGAYRNEHLGACNDCRWLNARKGIFE